MFVSLQMVRHVRDDVIFDKFKAWLDDDSGVDDVVTEIFVVGAL